VPQAPPRRLGERLLRLLPPVRRSLDQVPVYAEAWERANEQVLRSPPGTAPLWVVLGDSTAQAVGTAGIEHGYVARVRRLLERRDGADWQVLNLSRSGAVVADVLGVQLPRLAELGAAGVRPRLVSAVVGGNDLRRTPLPELLHRLGQLVEALPPGALVATLPRGLKEDKARVANALLRERAAARGLLLADLWARTGPPWRGKFAHRLHPNAVGLTDWVQAVREALGLPPEEPLAAR